MKKKWLSIGLALLLGLGSVGCAFDKAEEPHIEKEESSNTNKKSAKNDALENSREEKNRFGYENEEYDDFHYLRAYTVETDWADYVFYLPKGAEHTVDGHTMEAWGNKEGVDFIFMVNTDLNYRSETDYDPFAHSEEENLIRFVNILLYETSYYDSVEELEIADVFEDGNGAVTYVSFLRKTDDSYYQVFEQYYMFFNGDDYIISIIIVDGDHVTKKTEALLGEIATYLDYTVYYDENALPKVPEQSETSKEDEIEYTDYWKISLPQGWKRVRDDMDEYAYSPNGRYDADVIVFIDCLGEVGEGFLRDMDSEELTESMGDYLIGQDSDIQFSAEVIGELSVGYTIRFVMYDGETYSHIYMVEDGKRAFMLTSIGELGDERVAEAAEYIIQHAEMK